MLTNILRKSKPVLREADNERLHENGDRAERITLQKSHGPGVEDRVPDVALELRAQITEELRAQFSAELESRVAAIRGQYEQFAQRKKDDVFAAFPAELIEEIAATQAELHRKEAELARRLAEDASLGAISRLRAETRELSAYLNGLNFSAKIALDRP
jgi:hypothetical protein